MSETENDVELSKVLSHALRHEPWLYELELDDEGWAGIDVVVAALRQVREEWQVLSRRDVERLIASSSTRRHEISGERIRALYGHSVAGKLRRDPAAPPVSLFHGTSSEAAKMILCDGLKPMSRQYVHLSGDVATAWEVGRRKAHAPTLVEVEAIGAHAAGVSFYLGNEKVWLADFVPPQFLRTILRNKI